MDSDLSGNIDFNEPLTPGKKGLMAQITLSNVQWREWIQKKRESVQPWAQFVNYSKFKAPKTIAPLGKRIITNVEKFQSNYVFVFMGLVLFCIITSPMLLVAIAACLGACYIISLKNKENKVTVMGREITLVQQYAAVGAMSFPLFWIAGAGSAVFWVIGASVVVILLHASMYALDDELDDVVDLQAVPAVETV